MTEHEQNLRQQFDDLQRLLNAQRRLEHWDEMEKTASMMVDTLKMIQEIKSAFAI